MRPATTVVKVCHVLNELKGHSSVTLSEIAYRAGLLPSDAHRILASLETLGYVARDKNTRRYKVGYSLLQLSWNVTRSSALQRAGLPLLFQLSKRCNATANLAIFDRETAAVILINQAEVTYDGHFEGKVGEAKPAHCTALGKAVLAHLDQTFKFRAIDRSGLTERTAHTITRLNALERELSRVRHTGYALDCEEMTVAACCLASPIFDHTGEVIGSIGVTLNARRFEACPRKPLLESILTSAAMLSKQCLQPHVPQ